MNLFSNIRRIAQNRTTYDIGLIQARGYRMLKHLTATVVNKEGLSTSEWAMVGIISHHPGGVRSTEIAELLGVKPPLVSRLITRLEKEGWVTVIQGADKRERILSLTKQATIRLPKIEAQVRKELAQLLKGVSTSDLVGYLKTLSLIAENSKDIPQGSLRDYLPQ